MKKGIIAFAVILHCFAANANPRDSTVIKSKFLKPAELKEDYNILVKTLCEAYPSTYRYNTKVQLRAFFNSTLAKLSKPLTEYEFYPLIARTAAYMKDEHIIATPSTAYYEYHYKRQTKFLPFSIRLIGGRMYVFASDDSKLKAGMQIISIDNVPAKFIIGNLIKYIHRDGYISTFLYRHLEDYSPTQNENLFDLYYSFLYHLKDHVKLVVRTPNHEIIRLNCRSLNYGLYQSFYSKRKPQEPPLSFILKHDTSALLTISSFHQSYREYHKQNFDKLFEQIFNTLDSNKTRNLIIDLRHCEGGDNSYLQLLKYLMLKPFKVLDYIEVNYAGMPSTAKYFESTDNAFFADSLLFRTPGGKYRLKSKYKPTIAGYTDVYPAQKHFKGKLYVLTSGATGSAAAIFCSILRNAHRATFIGEETGGAMEGPTSLNIPILVLPNSKIRIEVPLIRLQLAVRYSKGRGVIPNYLVEPKKDDLINNRDAQLDFALKLCL
jgi:hypothetical protein